MKKLLAVLLMLLAGVIGIFWFDILRAIHPSEFSAGLMTALAIIGVVGLLDLSKAIWESSL